MCRIFEKHCVDMLCYKRFLLKFYYSSLEHVSPYLIKFAHLFFSVVAADNNIFSSKTVSDRSPRLILSNAPSLFRKLDELRAIVAASKPLLVCVTETWLLPNIDNNLINIPGFISFREDRQDNPDDNRCGGGTTVRDKKKWPPYFFRK